MDCLSFLKYEVSTPRNSGWRPEEVEITPILQDNSHKKRISNRSSVFTRLEVLGGSDVGVASQHRFGIAASERNNNIPILPQSPGDVPGLAT